MVQMTLKEFIGFEWSSFSTNSNRRNNTYYERRAQYWNEYIYLEWSKYMK